MSELDIALYGIVDADNLGAGNLAQFAADAAANGTTLIQYRDKNAGTRVMIERARAILARLAPFGVPLLINDRADVVLAVDAQGVHLGRNDMGADDARRLLGPDKIIGLTVKNETDADVAAHAPIDYACIGGVFATLSKINPDPPVGLDGFTRLAARMRLVRPNLPIGAIAGIDLEKAPRLIAAGADGVALISALFLSGDTAKTSRLFRAAIDQARQK